MKLGFRIFALGLVFSISQISNSIAEDSTSQCAIPPACTTLGFEQDFEQCMYGSDTVDCPTNGVPRSNDYREYKYWCRSCRIHWKAEGVGNDFKCVAADMCAEHPMDGTTPNPLYAGLANTMSIAATKDENSNTGIGAAVTALAYKPQNPIGEEIKAGNWYIPELGEWMQIRGFNYCNMSATNLSGGVIEPYDSSDMKKINDSLDEIDSDRILGDQYYWTSTLASGDNAWVFNPQTGEMTNRIVTDGNTYVRYFIFLQNIVCPESEDDEIPDSKKFKIGDIVYNEMVDGTYAHSSKEDYDSSKQAIGVVVWVSESGQSIKIVSADFEYPFEESDESMFELSSISPITEMAQYSDEVLLDTLYDESACKNICKLRDESNPFSGELYNGQENTQKIINDAGERHTQTINDDVQEFCIKSPGSSQCIENKHIAKGTWYVPSLGEWTDIYGFNSDAMCELVRNPPTSTTDERKWGADSSKGMYSTVNSKRTDTLSGEYWTSTEYSASNAWTFTPSSGIRDNKSKTTSLKVAYFNLLDNLFCTNPNTIGSNVKKGDIVYYNIEDDELLAFTNNNEAADYAQDYCYDDSDCLVKVGVVIWKSSEGQSVKIISAKDNASTTRWSDKQDDISTMTNYTMSSFESTFCGTSSHYFTSCTDSFGGVLLFDTKWGSKQYGQTTNSKNCSGSDKKRIVLKSDGTTLTCWHPECACASNETYSYDYRCERAYSSCQDFANQEQTEFNNQTRGAWGTYYKDYNVSNNDRNIACYPTADEADTMYGNDAGSAVRVIDINEGQVITLWSGYKDRCFPSYMVGDGNNNTPLYLCHAVSGDKTYFQYVYTSPNPSWRCQTQQQWHFKNWAKCRLRSDAWWQPYTNTARKVNCCKSWSPAW